MTTFYLRNPIEGTKLQRGQRIPWTLSKITCEPRGVDDDEPPQELLETALKEFVKEDGSRPTREELAALKLHEGVRDAMQRELWVEIGL